MKIKNKKIVITGSSSGIGKAILERLAAEPTNTVIAADKNPPAGGEFAKKGNVIYFTVDLSSREGVDALFEKIESEFDTCDMFFANAGAPYYEKFDYENWDRIEKIFNLNTVSPIYTYAKYLRHLNGRPGHLVYTVSAMGEMAIPGYSLYTGTKFAMKGFQQAVRLEKPKSMKITCIYPVSTATNFFNVAGNGVNVERPFPVQSPETVAKKTVRGLERNKKQIYPCGLFLFSKVLMTVFPFVRTIYWNNEKKRLERFLARKEAESKNK